MTWKQPKTTLTDLLLHNSDHMLDLKIKFIKFNENLNILFTFYIEKDCTFLHFTTVT